MAWDFLASHPRYFGQPCAVGLLWLAWEELSLRDQLFRHDLLYM
jgi:hypothetical protein